MRRLDLFLRWDAYIARQMRLKKRREIADISIYDLTGYRLAVKMTKPQIMTRLSGIIGKGQTCSPIIARDIRKRIMRGRLLRIVVLLWIGWYLSGPAAETFDYWDGPSQEVHDVMFNAGGGVTVAAFALFLILRSKTLRKRFTCPLRSVCLLVVSYTTKLVVFGSRLPLSASHSPPVPLPLRI